MSLVLALVSAMAAIHMERNAHCFAAHLLAAHFGIVAALSLAMGAVRFARL